MKSIRWSLMAACVSLLTACGGGGGGGEKPPLRQDTSGEIPVEPPIVTTPSASYAVIISDSTTNLYGYQLDIVDPSNAMLLRSIPIDEYDAWRTTLSRTQSSDGRTQTYKHETALYFVNGHRVHAVDLTRGSSTLPRQVSSITDACRILWHLDSDLGGKDSWLAIVTAGTDADCSTSNDNAFALVHSSLPATTAASAVPFNLAGLVTAGRNAAGVLESLITFEPSVGQFVHWRLDSSGAHPTAVSHGNGFSANADIRWLGGVPGFRDRGILEVDGTLRMLTWDSLGATLSASLASGVVASGTAGPLVAADDTRLYVIVQEPGQVILAFDGTSTAAFRVAPLDAAKGDATELVVSSDAVWVVQKDLAAPTAPSTLTSFTMFSGMSRQLDRYEVPTGLPTDIGLTLVGVNGTRLVYAKPSDTDDDDPVALYAIDHIVASPRLLAARVQGIGTHLASTALVGQARATTHLFWCDIGTPVAPVDCTAARFKDYNLDTGIVTSLGQHLVGADASAVLDVAHLGNDHGLNAIITAARVDYLSGSGSPTLTTTLWQFKPDTSGSLTLIARDGVATP